MTLDNEQTFTLGQGFSVNIKVFTEPELFNLVGVFRGTKLLRTYWSPLKPCKKHAKHFLKKYQDKKIKYSLAQKKTKHEKF